VGISENNAPNHKAERTHVPFTGRDEKANDQKQWL